MFVKIKSKYIDIIHMIYYNIVHQVNNILYLAYAWERMVFMMDIEKFCKENCVERRGTGTLKWDSLQEIFGDADLLPLWVADGGTVTGSSKRSAG